MCRFVFAWLIQNVVSNVEVNVELGTLNPSIFGTFVLLPKPGAGGDCWGQFMLFVSKASAMLEGTGIF